MLSDLVPAECTERMEYYKTIAAEREYSIERTRSVRNADGTDSHVTYNIVTLHLECYLVVRAPPMIRAWQHTRIQSPEPVTHPSCPLPQCCNMGMCFTAKDEEPTAGKEAMVQRTVYLQARKETDDPSEEAVFKAGLKSAQTAENVKDFQLFTALVGFCRLAMRKCDWLQPDFSIANVVFKEGDRMLELEYGMPKPEPRRLVKRAENLKTVRTSSNDELWARARVRPR